MKTHFLKCAEFCSIVLFIFLVISESPAQSKSPSQSVEDRLNRLETQQQVHKAILEKDKELKDLIEKEIQRSMEVQKQVQETASKATEAVSSIAKAVLVFITFLVTLLGLFGIKSFKDLRDEGEKRIKENSEKMEMYCKRVERDQHVIADIKQKIEEFHAGIKLLYEEAKNLPVESDFTKKKADLTEDEKLALSDVVLKFDIAEKLGVDLSADDYLKIATKNYYQKEYDMALKALEKAIKKKPNNPAAYLNWGVVLADLNKLEQAIEKYRKVIELKPDDAAAYSNWGNALTKLNKPEEAIEKYGMAIKLKPRHAGPYYNLACFYSIFRDPERCCANLETAINLNTSYKNKAKIDKDFDNVREEKCFKKLIEE